MGTPGRDNRRDFLSRVYVSLPGRLDKIDAIKKTAGSIQKSATKIESECTSITTSIRRLLDQALTSLAGSVRPSDSNLSIDGAA